MILVMGAVAFAAGENEDQEEPAGEPTSAPSVTTYTLSVDTTNNKANHTYKVYQIFTGTPSNDQLVDVRYGASFGANGNLVDGDTLKGIETQNDARAWVAANIENFDNEVATLDATTTSYDAVPGWYVILDTNYEYDAAREQDDTDAYSAYMVAVVNAAKTLDPKNSAPTVDKEVQDDEGTEWSDAADHEIGETFQFRLTATLPADINYDAYTTYPITFTDTMSSGVTFESIASVTVDGVSFTSYDCTATAGQVGGSWTLSIADVKTIDDINLTDGATIVVTYNAHLNTSALSYNENVAEETTNNNKVKLTYNNNPDATGDGSTDDTPEDYVWVFSYKSQNTNVDADGKPVAGAGFTLKYSNGVAISLWKVGTTYYVYDSTKTDYPNDGEAVTEMLTTEDNGGNAFNIVGLDVGTYTLTETTVPDGYNQCEDITISIEATHTENANLTSADLTLTQTNLNNEVVNQSGVTLPSTGGIGTSIFYVAGSILVLAAAILLVTKRRMSVEK